MTNKFSLPFKASFINLSPFVMNEETYYNKDANGKSNPPRTVFYAGADTSTKFYRLYNLKSNFLNLDINGLRHVITPTLSYVYTHAPTIRSSQLKQIDEIDAIGRSSSVTLGLSNKLQTKRKGVSVDFLDLWVTSAYNFYQFDPITNDKNHGSLADILIKLKLLPYAWVRFDADATYQPKQGNFSQVNYNFNFDFSKGRSLGLGQRYEYKGGNEITANLDWRVNPKWKFRVYQRYNMGNDPYVSRGMVEQEYTISRDLHCWEMDMTYNLKKREGNTFWLIFRLKAFPEMQLGFNQSYDRPASGSQINP
jgi:hypothetical protein